MRMADVRQEMSDQRQYNEDQERQLLNSARMIDAAPDPLKNAIFQQVRPRLGGFLPGLPDAYNEQVGQGIKAFIASRTNTGATPAGFQEFDMKARAAGLQPGTPEYQSAANIALGREGRASNAALQTVEVERPDGGVDRYTFNPRTGRYVPFGADMGTPLGVMIDPSLPQNVQDAIRANPQAFAAAPDGGTVQAGPQFVGGAGRGISAADKAAAETRARQAAELEFLPTRGQIEAENAAAKAAAEARAKTGAEVAAKQGQRSRDAEQILDLLDQAEQILPSATGSGAGTAADQAAAYFGISTPGAQATARLNLIAAQLVQKVPRFEGPQSNMDVQSYREAAGDLANSKNPVATRLAALRTMRALSARYAQQSQSGQPQRPALPPGFSWED